MRVWFCGFLFALAACSQSTTEDANAAPFDAGFGSIGPQCATDDQCVAAAPTCCECPTFAVPSDDALANACSNVPCPQMPSCPANVRAACSPDGRCELACVAMTCSTTCESGYAIDASGCLTCTCAPPTDGGCTADRDCAEVPADCCGCAHGGVDTAVLATQVDAHRMGLMCPTDPQCPSVNTCEPTATPQCIEGQCALSTGVLPPNACGRADLPACPSGQVCVVNQDAAATLEGVGVCVTP